MNKTKMILAGTGGAIGFVTLVLAFLVWQAFSAKTAAIEGDDEEGTDGLETVETRVQTLSRKPVYPSAASLAAIAENQRVIDEWCKESLALAARGDRVFPKTTPAQFKTDLVADAKRLMDFPGSAQGKLTKPDFAFGPFKNYIAEGKMPSETELAELQRRWDDVVTVTELLVTNGVSELVDVQFKAKAAEANEDKDRKDSRGKRDKRKSPQVAPATLVSPVAFSYVFTFAARPSAFIRTINALESCERFVTVDSFSLARPADVIAEAFGGDEKKAEAQASGRRGRRGRRGAETVEAPASKLAGTEGDAGSKNKIVTDPVLDAPMTVTLTLTVHDFRSLEDSGEEPVAEGRDSTAKKGASK